MFLSLYVSISFAFYDYLNRSDKYSCSSVAAYLIPRGGFSSSLFSKSVPDITSNVPFFAIFSHFFLSFCLHSLWVQVLYIQVMVWCPLFINHPSWTYLTVPKLVFSIDIKSSLSFGPGFPLVHTFLLSFWFDTLSACVMIVTLWHLWCYIYWPVLGIVYSSSDT